MVEKILNYYFTKKLLEEIKWIFIVRGLDYKFKNDGNRILVEAKQRKLKDDYYKPVVQIRKKDSFKYMCDLKKTEEEIEKLVDNKKL